MSQKVMDRAKIEIGPVIRKHREMGNYSQEGLSIISGITRPYISKIERGLCIPGLPQIVRIAQALQVSPLVIIEEALVSSEIQQIIMDTSESMHNRP